MRVTNRSNFNHNIAVFGGGVFMDNSTFEFNGFSNFHGNQVSYAGGGIYAARSVLKFDISSIIANYAARDGGGLYTRDGSEVSLVESNTYT